MRKDVFKQFFKFLVTGANNTALDFLILNLLMMIFNVYRGWPIICFNIISFSMAVINSYFVNRYWTFNILGDKKTRNGQYSIVVVIFIILLNLKFFHNNIPFFFLAAVFFILIVLNIIYIIRKTSKNKELSQNSAGFGKFVFVTLLGLLINSGIFYSLTSFISPPLNFSAVLWANYAKAIATAISLFWNFSVYKLVIFKK